ncbi:MAG: SAM-dependent methyltransferase [Candidatus Bilamarchaeaceae archaeon]
MKSVEKFMEEENRKYYSRKGKGIYSDFKTFAASRRLGRACALEFVHCARKADGELLVYDFGVGDGQFARNFLEEIEALDRGVGKRIAYVLWDVSEKMLEEAQLNLKGFSVESVCAPAEECRRMKSAFWVRANELLSDVPARVFVRKGKKIYEVGENNGEIAMAEESKPPKLAVERMRNAPELYWIPVNSRALGIVEEWKKKLRAGGGISIFDYGFYSEEEIREVPPEIWNGSVVRKYGGQPTVDVDFGFLEKKCGGRVERQDEFVRRMLGERVFAVEIGKMDYLSEEEIEEEREKIEKEGYDIELLKSGAETSPFYHYFYLGWGVRSI